MPKTTSRLITEADKDAFECECCSATANKNPWPEGWIEGGRSLKLIDPRPGISVIASWCPSCRSHVAGHNNPTSAEVSNRRKHLIAEGGD